MQKQHQIHMKSTIFMTGTYALIGAGAAAIWFNINSLIIDNMNKNACDTPKQSSTVDAVQSLYIWLTIVLVICFVGVVRGIRGFAEGEDVYDVKSIFSIIFMASTIGTSLMALQFGVRNNPIVKAMTSAFTLNQGGSIPANTTVTTFLNIMSVILGIAMLFILYKGKQLVDPPKEKAPTAAEAATSAHEYGPSHYDPSHYDPHGHGN